MTHVIPIGSTKRDRAIRFGGELIRAMKARDVGTRSVADSLTASRTSVMYWRTGRILPRMETVRKLAEALAWPRLVTLAIELRRKPCEVCDVEFVDDSGSDNRRFCTMSCQRVAEKRRMGSTTQNRAAVAEKRLKVHLRTVAGFCAACEPDGRCYAAECELRPVSPLPLFEKRVEIAPVQSRGNGWAASENRRVAAQGAQRRIWAALSPAERQERIDKAAEASKRARGLTA